MKDKNPAAAICGLYCGTCPAFGADCDGCLSDRVAPGCDVCLNGFRECAAAHKAARCYECAEFPCQRLKAFSKRHYVNGIGHHVHVIEDLQTMKDIGVGAWTDRQREEHTCKNCGKSILWYERGCPDCR